MINNYLVRINYVFRLLEHFLKGYAAPVRTTTVEHYVFVDNTCKLICTLEKELYDSVADIDHDCYLKTQIRISFNANRCICVIFIVQNILTTVLLNTD